MKNKTIKQLLIECIGYTTYMDELHFTKYDKERLYEYSDRLEGIREPRRRRIKR